MGLEIAGLVIIAVALGYVLLPAVFVEVRAAKTPRSVVCPENQESVQVSLDPGRAVRSLFVLQSPCVVSCTRWPEKAGCHRECEASLTT